MNMRTADMYYLAKKKLLTFAFIMELTVQIITLRYSKETLLLPIPMTHRL